MIKSLLILGLILISFPSATSSQFTKITKEVNQKRSDHCGIRKHQNQKTFTRATDAPWHARIFKNLDDPIVASGVLISPIHILTDYVIPENGSDKKSKPNCQDGIVSTSQLGQSGRDNITVEFQICDYGKGCGAMLPVKRRIIREQGFGDCVGFFTTLMLIEIDSPIEATPICLPSKVLNKNGKVIAEVYNENMYAPVVTKFVSDGTLAAATDYKPKNPKFLQRAIPLVTKRDGRVEIVAIGKHSYKKEEIEGFYLVITDKYIDLICNLTGVCKTETGDGTKPEPSQPPGATQTSEASQVTQMNQQPPGPTDKSRSNVDWPPPIPSVRTRVPEPTVDHLPQTDEEYEYENQLLMEYEQLEKEEREKEKKEKKGTERWNVLVAVGVTVLIGLI